MKKLIILLTVVFFVLAGVTYAQTVDPNDLKKSDPKPPSLKINPPPPLPDPPKKEPSTVDKIKNKIEKEKKEFREKPSQPNPDGGPIRGEFKLQVHHFICAAESYIMLASENCVCAECNKKCGTGHETWCSSYQKPKAKSEIVTDLLVLNTNTGVNANCIEKDLMCILNGTPCCAPYECKG